MKKNFLTLFCCIFVLVSIIVALIFAFGETEQLPSENHTVALKGEWIIAASYNNDIYTPISNQFAKFSENEVSITEGTNQKTTRYTINEMNELVLNDGKTYKISPKTQNCIRLYDSQSTCLLLVKNSNNAEKPQSVTLDLLEGKWNVVLKGSEINNGDILIFEENLIKYLKNGSDTPVAQSTVTIEGNVLSAETMNITMSCYISDSNTIILIENNGNVWEITRN